MKIQLSTAEAQELLDLAHSRRRELEVDIGRGIVGGKDVIDVTKKLELIRKVIPKLAGNA